MDDVERFLLAVGFMACMLALLGGTMFAVMLVGSWARYSLRRVAYRFQCWRNRKTYDQAQAALKLAKQTFEWQDMVDDLKRAEGARDRAVAFADTLSREQVRLKLEIKDLENELEDRKDQLRKIGGFDSDVAHYKRMWDASANESAKLDRKVGNLTKELATRTDELQGARPPPGGLYPDPASKKPMNKCGFTPARTGPGWTLTCLKPAGHGDQHWAKDPEGGGLYFKDGDGHCSRLGCHLPSTHDGACEGVAGTLP